MEHLSSVKNSSRLLKLFLDGPKEMGVSDLSRKLQMSKGAVHKLLATLESEGFIRQNPATKQYLLGYTLLELGNQVLKNHNLADFAKPYMQKLSEASKELVCLCVKDGRDAIYVEKIDSPYPIRFHIEMYRRFPLYATSAARAILAHSEDAFVEELLQEEIKTFTPHSLKDSDSVRARLSDIRTRGYEFSSNMRNIGVSGIASPIFDTSGWAVASISIIGPSDRMTPAKDSFAELLMEVTGDISLQLGYRTKQIGS